MNRRGRSSTAEAAPARIDAALSRRARALMHDQCWCWGRDIHHHDVHGAGNLLIAHGLRRIAGPTGSAFGYASAEDVAPAVLLIGAGMFFGVPGRGGLIMGRYAEDSDAIGHPRATEAWQPAAKAWASGGAAEFHAAGQPASTEALAALLPDAYRWIASYERWVAEHAGAGHRARCLEEWGRSDERAETLADAWDELADLTDAYLTNAYLTTAALQPPLGDPT